MHVLIITQGEPSCRSLLALSAALWLSILLILWGPCSEFTASVSLHLHFPLVPLLGNFLTSVSLIICRAHLICFLTLKDHCPLSPVVQCLENCCVICFLRFMLFFRHECKCSPYYCLWLCLYWKQNFCLFIFKLVFFLNIYFLYYYYFWMCWVLIAARGIFVEACGIFFVVARALFIAALGLLSSCGVRVFSL